MTLLLAIAAGLCFAIGGAAICAAVLLAFGVSPPWEVIAWAAACGLVGGTLGGYKP